ncbi:MAG: hypothetical protein AB1489_28760 [Acidobacteriota bacterium]
MNKGWCLQYAAIAASRTKYTYLRDKFYRLKARRDYQWVILVIAHKSLISTHMLLTTTLYHKLGEIYFDKMDKSHVAFNIVQRP